MPHPNGGRGNTFRTHHTFAQAYSHVSRIAVRFRSTTDEPITATASVAADGKTPTIVFRGVNSIHGNVCSACWGYRQNCSGARIGHCVEPLDLIVP